MGRPANLVKVVINVTALFLLNVSNIGDNLFLPHFSSNRKNKTEIFSDIWLSMLSEDEPKLFPGLIISVVLFML